MTVEELKKAADELGYNIVKKHQPLPKLLECSCGANNRLYGMRAGGVNKRAGRFIACESCGLEGEPGRTKHEMYENWNRAVLESKSK